MAKIEPAILDRLERYVARLDELCVAYYEDRFDHIEAPELCVEFGRKYAKVIKGCRGGSSRSVHTFIDLTNGNILKAASYKAPAPNGVRGNIFDDDCGMSCVGPYGALYVNGPNINF